MKRLISILTIVVVMFSLVACNGGAPKDAVAKVNDKLIKSVEFEKNLALAKKGYEAMYGEEIWTKDAGEGKTFLEVVKAQILDKMISDEVKYQEAVKKGIKADEAEINDQMEQFKQNIEKDEQIKKFMEENGIDDEFLKAQIEKELIVMKFEQDFKDNFKVEDSNAKEYYEKNKESYRNNQVKASHILIKTVDGSLSPLPEEEIAKKKEIAQDILQKAKDGEDFAQLAKDYSEDEGSAPNGGDLGFFKKGVMVPEFENAAFGLEKGQMSELVQSQFGYHIIKVYDKIDETPGFEEVKESIVEQMRQDEYESHIEKLMEKAKIEKYIEEKK